MKKFFTLFIAALMSAGMCATTEVTITDSDFPASESSFTKDGVTVSAGMIDRSYGNIMRGGSFSTTLGNFTKIEVTASDLHSMSGDGWSGDNERQTWTGNASSVSFSGAIMGNGQGVTLKFTIEESAPTTKYYVVGDMTNWEVNADYEMTPNNVRVDTDEEYKFDITLTTSNQFKVVKVEGETQTWYPDGMGNNYGEHGEIERDGDYTIYFRPNMDGGEAWFYNCILATRHTEPERVFVGFLFPEYGMPANGISMLGSFIDGTVELSYVEETGGYMHDHIMAVDEDKFYLRATDDVDNFLFAYVDGAWDMAEFTFDEVWEDDTWKGEPVKMIDLDLSDNSKYAWQKAIPEGLENVTMDKAQSTKVMIDGMLYIIRDGKMFNVLGTEVK